MFWKANIRISKTMYANLVPVVYIFRIFGIFPYVFVRSSLGIFMKWSFQYAFYSCVLILVLTITLLYEGVMGLIGNSGVKLDIINNLDKLVWLTSVTTYCAAMLVVVFITPTRFPLLRSHIKCINDVDSMIDLNPVSNRKFKLMAFAAFAFTVVIISFNFYLYATLITNTRDFIIRMVTRTIPFSITVLIDIMTDSMIQHMTHNLNMRIISLNKALDNHYTKLNNRCKIDYEPYENVISTSERVDAADIIKMNKAYLRIIEAARKLNDLFGLSILILLASSVLLLISTPYYFVLSLESKRRGFIEIILRICVFAQQMSRTLLHIEPKHECILGVKTAAHHVCNLLSLNTGKYYKKKVNAMAKSVFLNNLNFSACGFYDINRGLITTLVGTITTYLVILLQAEETLN